MAAATSSQVLRSVLRTVIFIVTCPVCASLARTSTSWPPLNTPANSSVCDVLLGSTWSDLSQACMPRKPVICFTASERQKKTKNSKNWMLTSNKQAFPFEHLQDYTRSVPRWRVGFVVMVTLNVFHWAQCICTLGLVLFSNLLPRGSKVWLNNPLHVVREKDINILQLERERKTLYYNIEFSVT